MSTRSSQRQPANRAHPRPAPSRAARNWLLWATFVLHLVIGAAGPLVHHHWRAPGSGTGDSVVAADFAAGDHVAQDESLCVVCDALAAVAAPGAPAPEVRAVAASRLDVPPPGRAPPSLSVSSPSARAPPAA